MGRNGDLLSEWYVWLSEWYVLSSEWIMVWPLKGIKQCTAIGHNKKGDTRFPRHRPFLNNPYWFIPYLLLQLQFLQLLQQLR